MNVDDAMPLPAGAVEGGEFNGSSRTVCGPDHKVGQALVYAWAVQTTDGRIKHPSVRLECSPDDALSIDQARQLAAEILKAADEADGWG